MMSLIVLMYQLHTGANSAPSPQLLAIAADRHSLMLRVTALIIKAEINVGDTAKLL